MEKPYIKKHSDISGFTVWIVDGGYIRANLDIDFTNFGQHLRFKFIPEKEFWIDKEYGSDESKYFITHMLIENQLMSEGKKYQEALEKADEEEKKQREESEEIIDAKKLNNEELLKIIHEEFLEKYSTENLKVWVVDGELVRGLFFIDFTEGGSDKNYKFIPEGEVWLDNDLSPRERKFVLLHELHERRFLIKGLEYGADFLTEKWEKTKTKKSAHKRASEKELFFRKNPKNLDKELRREIKRNKK
jgi:hypothetical protein